LEPAIQAGNHVHACKRLTASQTGTGLAELLITHGPTWLLFAIAGITAGVINTLAGSGSLITLPIFMFLCGLPANVANGTNRVGAIFQSAIGLYGFRKSGKVDYQDSAWIVVPAIIGALIGAWLASEMSAKQMEIVIGGLMVVMLVVLTANPKRWLRESDASTRNNRRLVSVLSYFAIGIYGGFIQAGVGIFLLIALVLVSKYSLKEANGVKMLVILGFAIPTLCVFAYNNQVHFGYAFAMAGFQSIGAVIGVRFATRVPNANVWIHRLLIVILISAATKIFFFS